MSGKKQKNNNQSWSYRISCLMTHQTRKDQKSLAFRVTLQKNNTSSFYVKSININPTKTTFLAFWLVGLCRTCQSMSNIVNHWPGITKELHQHGHDGDVIVIDKIRLTLVPFSCQLTHCYMAVLHLDNYANSTKTPYTFIGKFRISSYIFSNTGHENKLSTLEDL